MAAPCGRTVLTTAYRIFTISPTCIRGSAVKVSPLSSCRLFGSIRKKTDELKEGYAPRDQHLEGKSPEEVIKDLLAQDAGRPRKKTRSDYCKE